ncbi:MAG: S41 family peptidase [Polyangiales bacterium]
MRPRTLGSIAVLCFAGGWLSSSLGVAPSAWGAKNTESPHATIEQLAKVLVQVENRYVDPVDRDRLLTGAIKGMVAELDPHSEYFPPKDYGEFTSETTGKFGGVGLEVDARGEWLTVIAPIEGGPAEAAGVRSGDEIVSIDGTDAKGLSLEKSVRMMRGEAGTKVEIVIRRPSEAGKLYRVPLVRAEIRVPSVTWDVLPDGVVYLRIKQFQEKTHEELIDAIGKAKAKIGGKILGVVLDMRRNPGGLVNQAVDVADEFLESGLIFSMRGQGKTLEETKASMGGALTSQPMAVLVDESSASAAELVAGALQDHHRAVIVGVQTFGKGSVQSIIELPGGAGLKLTTARYYTPSGRSIQAQGITPDVVVEATRVVAPPSGTIVKEKDLEHALPAEGGKGGDAGVPLLQKDAGASDAAPSSTDGGVEQAPLIPGKKPEMDKDFPLRMAHQLVVGVLMKKKAP